MYDYVALRCFWQYGFFARKIGVYAVYAQVPTGSEANYFVCNFGVDCCGSVGFSICHREQKHSCVFSREFQDLPMHDISLLHDIPAI